MSKTARTLLVAGAAIIALPGLALAQTETTTTRTTTTVTTTVVPDTVRTYVTGQTLPSVAVDGDLVVGQPLPEIVSITPIPDNADYGYAVVNERRVIINPADRTIVEVYD